jgi:ergothioneine biosynthesis protein EgtB
MELCAPLTTEDQLIQPMADASPTKWHLAHTTWFFERIVLGTQDSELDFLFNSYYEALGPRVERGRRGMLSRPSLERVHRYRCEVDEKVVESLDTCNAALLELGIHHEQQHQELILSDIKCALGTQPLRPLYRELSHASVGRPTAAWQPFAGGLMTIGASDTEFAFDNERPRHRVFVEPFDLSSRALTNGDVLDFIAAGGYRDSRYWLSDGWATAKTEGWQAPLYWDGGQLYTLGGLRRIDPDETACHLSYYEADAIARFRGARLPTEAEWEVAAQALDPEVGNYADDEHLHPGSGTMFGDIWEWTSSSYSPYPGFRTLEGAVGEYNGKFMSGQQVLRGGSCLSPRGHIRASYRNFFPPAARWQMTGARLARDSTH